MADNTTIDELKAPLLAALGAADLALATVNDLLIELRDRAEETRTDTSAASRCALMKLPMSDAAVDTTAARFSSCGMATPRVGCSVRTRPQ